MKKFLSSFEGLKGYELVLGTLGVVLFFVLVGVLIFLVATGKPIKPLLVAFLLPIVMIGFPGIQKIIYENGKLEIIRQTAAVEEKPESVDAKNELRKALEAVEERAGLSTQDPTGEAEASPETALLTAKGRLVLGDAEEAFDQSKFVLETSPQNEAAAKVHQEAATDLVQNEPGAETLNNHTNVTLRQATEFLLDKDNLSPEVDAAVIGRLRDFGQSEAADRKLQDLQIRHPEFQLSPQMGRPSSVE